MADQNTVELEIRAKALLGDAQQQISAFLKEIEDRTGKTAKASKGLAGEVEAFYKKHKESFKASAEFLAIFSGAVATAVATVVAMGMHGSEVDDLTNAFAHLTQEAGNFNEVLGTLRESTDGVISDMTLMRTVNFGFSQGLRLTADQMKLTGEAARVLANSTGGDAATAFEQLVRSMAIGQERLLRQVGLQIDASRAVDQYAASIGKSTDRLTENERRIAVRNAILEAMQRRVDSNGRAEVSFADKIKQSTVEMANFWDQLSKAVAKSPVLLAGMDGIKQGLINAFGGDQQKAIREITKLIGAFAIGLIGVAPIVVESIRYIVNAFSGLRAGFNAMMATIEGHEVERLEGRLKAAQRGVSILHNDVHKIDELKIALAGAQGRLKSYQQSWTDSLDNMDMVDNAMNKVRAAIALAQAEMEKAVQSNEDVAVAAPKAGKALEKVGDDAYTSVAQLKAFRQQLDDITQSADEAMISATHTGVEARLLLLESQTASKVKKINQDTSLDSKQQAELVTETTKAAAKEREAILLDADRSVSASQMKTNYTILQSQIEAGRQGLDAKLESLDMQRAAEIAALSLQYGDTVEAAELRGREEARIEEEYAEKERVVRVEYSRETSNELWQIQQQLNGIMSGLFMDNLHAALAANEAEYQDRLRTLTQMGQADEAHLDATKELYAAKAQAIILNNDPIFKAWKSLNTDMRETWADTWDQALKKEISWQEAALKPFKDFGNALLHIFSSILVAIEMSFLAPLQNMLVKQIGSLLYGSGGGGMFGGGGGGAGNAVGSTASSVGRGLLQKWLFGGGTTAGTAAAGGALGGAAAVGSSGAAAGAYTGAYGANIVAGGTGATGGGAALGAFFTNPWTIGIGAAIGVGYAIYKARRNETKEDRLNFSNQMGYATVDEMLDHLAWKDPEKAEQLRKEAVGIIGKHDVSANGRWMRSVQAAFQGPPPPHVFGSFSEATDLERAGLTSGGFQLAGPGRMYAAIAGATGYPRTPGKKPGQAPAGNTTNVTLTVNTIDADSFRKFLRDGGGTEEITAHYRESGAAKVKLQQALA